MGLVTLVGEPWARVGQRFLNVQPCEYAGACPVAKPCQGLQWDRPYRVVAVRNVKHKVCQVHEGGVRVVEVEETPVEASLETSRTRGTAARWTPLACRFRGCPNWDRCFPHGLQAGEEYQLSKVGARLECPMGYELSAVSLRPRPTRG